VYKSAGSEALFGEAPGVDIILTKAAEFITSCVPRLFFKNQLFTVKKNLGKI